MYQRIKTNWAYMGMLDQHDHDTVFISIKLRHLAYCSMNA